MKKAIILLAGGLDSTTCLAIAKATFFDCYALTFSYGQKHHSEIAAAKQIAKKFGVIEHRIFNLPMYEFGGSALTDIQLEVPEYNASKKIPATYVPARNTIFLSIALAWAEIIDCQDIFFGANQQDYNGYPDCRSEYFRAYEELAKLSTKAAIEEQKSLRIHTPLLHFSKKEIIETAVGLGVDINMTVSCYSADSKGHACGICDSCTLRRQGFHDAQIPDPTYYQSKKLPNEISSTVGV